MEIKNQKIILTGAASGIGKSVLSLLSRYGCTILAVDIQKEALENTIKEFQNQAANIILYTCDLSRKEEVDDLFNFGLQQMGGIDIFIANAGFAYYETVQKPDWQRLEKIFQVNVFSPIYSLQKMKELNQGKPYYVIATASAMAKLGVPGYAVYGATKAALGRFEDAYRYEPKDKGTFGLVYPIATRTNFFSAASKKDVPIPFPSQTAEQVAKAIVLGIKHNKKAIFPSTVFKISRIPQVVFEWISKPYQIYYAGVLKKWIGENR